MRISSRLSLLAAALGLASSGWSCQAGSGHSPAAPPAATASEPRLVDRIEDGDTIRLADGASVRYLGIDTPERGDPLHGAALEFNRELVAGRSVTLDWGGPEETDRYGRLLAVVRRVDGDTAEPESVNARLLRAGLASVYISGPESLDPRYLETLIAAQREAIEARRGLWRRWLEPRPAGAELLVSTRFRVHLESCTELQNARPRPVDSLGAELRQGKSPCRACKPLDKR